MFQYLREVNFHWSSNELPKLSYLENMENVWEVALTSLVKAQEEGQQYVMFTHGWSTSQGKKRLHGRRLEN
jgi:hypothetical protein